MSQRHPTPDERDERVSIPLDPETALRGLLAVGPDDDDGDHDHDQDDESAD